MTDLSPHSALNPDKLPRPFSVGLSALDPVDWIMPDVHLADQLRGKGEHFAQRREAVFQAEDDTLAAQAETLALLLDHLPRSLSGHLQGIR